MTYSSKKIIKLRQPVKKVTVLPLENGAAAEVRHSGENPAESRNREFDDLIRISRAELQQEIDFHYNKGLEEGKLNGYQQAEADFGNRVHQLGRVMESFESEKQRFFEESEAQLIDLSLRVTEKIIPELPAFLPGLLKNTIRQVLDVLSNEPGMEVLIHPDDMNDLQELETLFREALPQLEQIAIKPDKRISRGGCMVQTDNGKIDARIETQIAVLIAEMRKELKRLKSGWEADETDS